jgi:hypothetical protein
MPTASQLIYAVTMLCRWAKIAAPQNTQHAYPSPMPSDLSSNTTTSTLAIIEAVNMAAMHVSTPSGSSTTAASAASPEPPTPHPLWHTRECMEPGLAAAVAALKNQLATQPGLMLNTPELFSAIRSKLEQASLLISEDPTEPGQWNGNIWGLSATKVRITQAKLERWAEIIATGVGGHLRCNDHQSGIPDGTDSDDDEVHGGGHMIAADTVMTGVTGAYNPLLYSNPEGWAVNTQWSNDLFEGLDPGLWYEGTGDWGVTMMNPLGNIQ